jgi:hypothetical protein
LTFVGGIVNQLGRQWRDGGVKGAEKARVSKDVNLRCTTRYMIYACQNNLHNNSLLNVPTEETKATAHLVIEPILFFVLIVDTPFGATQLGAVNHNGLGVRLLRLAAAVYLMFG